jgi:hypothetical protein
MVLRVGVLFNTTSGTDSQRDIEIWIKENYSHLWDEMESIGIVEDQFGTRTVKIDRTIDV